MAWARHGFRSMETMRKNLGKQCSADVGLCHWRASPWPARMSSRLGDVAQRGTATPVSVAVSQDLQQQRLDPRLGDHHRRDHRYQRHQLHPGGQRLVRRALGRLGLGEFQVATLPAGKETDLQQHPVLDHLQPADLQRGRITPATSTPITITGTLNGAITGNTATSRASWRSSTRSPARSSPRPTART